MTKKKIKSTSFTSFSSQEVEEVAEEPTFPVVEEEKLEEIDLRTVPIDKLWELYPKLDHLTGTMREQLEERRRLRKVRYMLFRLRTQVERKNPLEDIEGLLPGFIEFWENEVPLYGLDPQKRKCPVPEHKAQKTKDLGGFGTFAQNWDVDHDLNVYLRHSSVWQEWNATLHRIVPIIGE